MRDFDKTAEERKREDVNHIGIEIKEELKEENVGGKSKMDFYVCCIDESEYVNIFNSKTMNNNGKGGFSQKIKKAPGLAEEIKKKDLFGMGYPYLVTYYGNYVACSTDYGICLLEINDKSNLWTI